jgi:hypothetical protein
MFEDESSVSTSGELKDTTPRVAAKFLPQLKLGASAAAVKETKVSSDIIPKTVDAVSESYDEIKNALGRIVPHL